MHDILIFDLDGTLSDPRDGIFNCINHALASNDLPMVQPEDVDPYIGPPLDQTFIALTGISDETMIHSLVQQYRDHYGEVGYTENRLYDGIRELLIELSSSDRLKLGLCTSKRRDFAVNILRHFGLCDYFDFIRGGGVGIDKQMQIGQLLDEGAITTNSLMIGDRGVDISAAHDNGLSAAGVLWGYGSEQELNQQHPEYLFRQPDELSRLGTD